MRTTIFLASISLILLEGCGSNGITGTGTTQNPTPIIQSLSPTSFPPGGAGFTLTVNGTGFVSSSQVLWNGSGRATTYLSSTQLTAAILASDVTTGGQISITVTSPLPGGGTSAAVQFAVQYPLPAITSLSPAQASIAGGAFTLTVTGTNFFSGATVNWNQIARVTTYVSSTDLQAAILASDLQATAGNAAITVTNPSPNAGISNSVQFGLDNPAPIFSSITPNSAIAGEAVQLTVAGTGFQQGATLQLDGTSWPTGFASNTQLTATVTPSTVGKFPVTVTNPAPTPGPSGSLPFTATAAGLGVAPTVVSIDPAGNMIAGFGGRMSSTGRYIVFQNYLRDTCANVSGNCTPSTTQAFSDATSLGYIPSDSAQFVAFGPRISPHAVGLSMQNTCLGATGCQTATISSPYNTTVTGIGGPTSISSDGRYVPFAKATETNDMAMYDFCSNAPAGCVPSEIELGDDNQTDLFVAPVITREGRYAIYAQYVQGTNSTPPGNQVVFRDTCIGASAGCAPASYDLTPATESCSSVTISGNGAYIAYYCSGTIYVLQCEVDGCSKPTSAASFNPNFNGTPFIPSQLYLSDSGRYVAFQLTSDPETTAFIEDTCIGTTGPCTPQVEPVCVNGQGALANNICTVEGMSSDGRYLSYYSTATNLVSGAPAAAVYLAPNPLLQ